MPKVFNEVVQINNIAEDNIKTQIGDRFISVAQRKQKKPRKPIFNSQLGGGVLGTGALTLFVPDAIISIGDKDIDGGLTVFNNKNKVVFEFNGATAVLTIGGKSSSGSIFVTDKKGEPTIHLDGDQGDVVLLGADCAEEFAISEDEGEVETGTVMSIDETGMLRRSRIAYDRCVAGVVSGAGTYRPGIILGRTPDMKSKLPIALVGRVFCKVDARKSPVNVGDLLTTADEPGFAMKAVDTNRAFGAVIGKALQPLTSGADLVPILVALQ